MPPVIETVNLTKVYEGALRGQDVKALQNLTIAIEEREIFGYLGPNGSGKTTTIKMLLGLIFPTSGDIRIMGKTDIGAAAIRKSIGYLPEGAYYPDFLRGEEILRFYGQLYGLSGKNLEKRIDATLELVGMTRARKRLLRGYSKGMRQRIGLAQALLHDPKILILDEPTTGLDPVARKEIRDMLVRLRSEGKSLLISSHELLEVELISDRVGILFEGVLQTLGTIQELLADRDVTVDTAGVTDAAIRALGERGIISDDVIEGKARFRVPPSLSIYDALEVMKSQNLTIVGVAPRRETLEELFVRVVGEARLRRDNEGKKAS
ncbi:MAG: ABC transporter ATP-binding protein [Candidatus Hydrogenedentes bacterium]|nr:ABC transporter ATP-binding protein [Candidatus Hydrogenedentota bacterium]